MDAAQKIMELEAELAKLKTPASVADAPVRLDFGCGPHPREGFTGVDIQQFDGKVGYVLDLRQKWPWFDGTVDEFHSSHFVEHLTWPERVHFFNELYRVCKPGAKGQIITPHPFSVRFYGDPTHKEPMSEFAYYYLSREWRKQNAPHVPYECDFEATWGYSLAPWLAGRNQEFTNNAIQWYCDARQDIIATLIARK